MSSSLFLGSTIEPFITSFTQILIILYVSKEKKALQDWHKGTAVSATYYNQVCISAQLNIQLNKAHEPSELFLLH